jgi:hypothetical protein
VAGPRAAKEVRCVHVCVAQYHRNGLVTADPLHHRQVDPGGGDGVAKRPIDPRPVSGAGVLVRRWKDPPCPVVAQIALASEQRRQFWGDRLRPSELSPALNNPTGSA